MFHSESLKCEVCGHLMTGLFNHLAELICTDCKKAIFDAKEQQNYLNFFKLQETIKRAEAAGISHRQMADTIECIPSTIQRYLDGVSRPMPRTCVHMTKLIENLINGV